jgi:hypothetical protein
MYLSSDQIFTKTAALLRVNRIEEEEIIKVVYPSRYESSWESFKSFPEEFKKIVGRDFTIFYNYGDITFLWDSPNTRTYNPKRSKAR